MNLLRILGSNGEHGSCSRPDMHGSQSKTALPFIALLSAAVALSGSTGCTAETALTGEVDALDQSTHPLVSAATLPSGYSNIAPMAAGAGWSSVRMTGSMPNIDTGLMQAADDELILIDAVDGLRTAPLGPQTKGALEQSFRTAPSDTVYVVSRRQADLFETTTVNVGAAARSSCVDYDKTYEKSVSATRSLGHAVSDNTGAFTGSAALGASVSAGIGARLTLKVKRSDTFLGCITYGVGFRRFELYGYAEAQAGVQLNGSFSRAWHYEKNIAKPTIGTFNFFVGPIPVHMGFNLPIDVGVDAAAAGQMQLDITAKARADFSAGCTTSDCYADKNFTLTNTLNGDPNGTANGNIDVNPWVQASVRGYLYTEGFVSAQVGVRPKLLASLWVYNGNTCGDANSDGINEWVSARTFNSAVTVDLTAKVHAFGRDRWQAAWPILSPKHLYFTDLVPGGSSALRPIFREVQPDINTLPLADDPRSAGTIRTFRTSMRPCWPFTQDVHYTFNWGDGSPTQFMRRSTTGFDVQHTFPSAGAYTARATALYDTNARAIGATTTLLVGAPPRATPIFVGGFL